MEGHLHFVQWQCKMLPFIDYDCWEPAFSIGHVSIIQWIHENRMPLNLPMGVHSAAMNGHLPLLLYLKDNTILETSPFVQESLRAGALCGGQAHILDWLHAWKGTDFLKFSLDNLVPVSGASFPFPVSTLDWFHGHPVYRDWFREILDTILYEHCFTCQWPPGNKHTMAVAYWLYDNEPKYSILFNLPQFSLVAKTKEVYQLPFDVYTPMMSDTTRHDED